MEFVFIWWHKISKFQLLQVQCIEMQVIDGSVNHSFVKALVFCNFDVFSFMVEPNDVACNVCNEAKENAFANVVLEFSVARRRLFCPHTTSKCLEVVKVLFSFVHHFDC